MSLPDERHEREQYFFDPATVDELCGILARFERPCCLCAPSVGAEMHRRGRVVRILDTDRRFAHLPGFLEWDLYRPRRLGETFDLILCDPPFFNVSLSQPFIAPRVLCHYDLARPVLISFLARRSGAIMGALAPFNLRPTGYRPRYLTVQRCERNDIEFLSSIDLPLPATEDRAC
jgi:hypothetical protein